MGKVLLLRDRGGGMPWRREDDKIRGQEERLLLNIS